LRRIDAVMDHQCKVETTETVVVVHFTHGSETLEVRRFLGRAPTVLTFGKRATMNAMLNGNQSPMRSGKATAANTSSHGGCRGARHRLAEDPNRTIFVWLPTRTPDDPGGYNAEMLLVVDDDGDLLRMLGTLFTRSNVPHVCASSLEAVQALGSLLPTLTTALLDINLGAGQPTGVDIAEWLRHNNFTSRIIFITGHAPDHVLMKSAAGISDRILEKPIVTKELLQIVRDGL